MIQQLQKVAASAVNSKTIRIPTLAKLSRSHPSFHSSRTPLSSFPTTTLKQTFTASRFTSQSLQHQLRSLATTTVHASADETALPGDYVEVHYTGTLDDGTEFDSSRPRGETLPFVVGEGMVVPGFENMLVGMKVGDSKKERIPAEMAYGEPRENMTAKLPISQAPEGLQAGAMVELTNGMTAIVTAVDDEFVTIDANHPLAGEALTFEVELMKLVHASAMQRAAFGAGCFWGVELKFQRLPGVIATEVGYSQGANDEVTYEEVCRGDTGHVEVVKVTYDETELPFEKLCEFFFEQHDPTTLNRQGNDVGDQYRSGVYYTDNDQKEIAERVLDKMQKKFSGQVVTECEELNNYVKAEDYHQQYLAKGGRHGRPQSPKKGCNDPIRCYG